MRSTAIPGWCTGCLLVGLARPVHVHGYREEGTTTTPFDMTELNGLDRFHLAMDVIDRVPRLQAIAAHLRQHLSDRLAEHRHYVDTHGEDLPEVNDWRWSGVVAAA